MFISFACPKETNQRKRPFFVGIFQRKLKIVRQTLRRPSIGTPEFQSFARTILAKKKKTKVYNC